MKNLKVSLIVSIMFFIDRIWHDEAIERFKTWLFQWTYNARGANARMRACTPTRENDIADARLCACPLAFVISLPRLDGHSIMALEMLSPSVLSRYTKSKNTSFTSGCSGLRLSKKRRHTAEYQLYKKAAGHLRGGGGGGGRCGAHPLHPSPRSAPTPCFS